MRAHFSPVPNISEPVDTVGLVIGVSRIVDEGERLDVRVGTGVLLGKAEGRRREVSSSRGPSERKGGSRR